MQGTTYPVKEKEQMKAVKSFESVENECSYFFYLNHLPFTLTLVMDELIEHIQNEAIDVYYLLIT